MGSFKLIPPSGQSAVITHAKDESGTAVTLWSDAARTVTVSLPATVTGATVLYPPAGLHDVWVRATVGGSLATRGGGLSLAEYSIASMGRRDAPPVEVPIGIDPGAAQVVESPPTPQRYREAGDPDWTLAFQRLLAAGHSSVHVPAATAPYDITAGLVSPVSIKSFTLDQGATIRATAAISGAMLTIGDLATQKRFGVLEGGTFECNGLANDGIKVPWSWGQAIRNTVINNHARHGLVMGDASAPSSSAQHKVHGVETWRSVGSALPSGSRGVWLANASDGDMSAVTVQSADIGFWTDSGGNRFYSCHTWSSNGVGLHTTSFLDNGGNNDWIACNSDSASTYGWHLKQWWSRIIGGFSSFFDPTRDNIPVGIHIDCGGSEYRGSVTNHRWVGSGSGRWNTDYDGNVTNPDFTYQGCSGLYVTNPKLSARSVIGHQLQAVTDANVPPLVANSLGSGNTDLFQVQKAGVGKFIIDQYGVAYMVAGYSTNQMRVGNGTMIGPGIWGGTGSPNGVISGTAGDVWVRSDGAGGSWLYRCTGGTAWTASTA